MPATSPGRPLSAGRLLVAVVLFAVAATGVAAGAASGPVPAQSAELSPPNGSTSAATPVHPNVADGLLDAPDRLFTAGSKITVVFETDPGATDRIARTLERHGTVQLRGDTMVRATVSRDVVPSLAGRPGVQFVRAPRRLSALGSTTGSVTSEGVGIIDADEAQSAGYTGEGVTVAVIDVGFDVSDPEIAGNVVQTKDFTGEGIDGGGRTNHGTATAQIVVDTAPDADLVLVSVQSYAGLVEAIDWVRTETGADVASLSLGLRGGAPLDGTARADKAIAKSARAGTVWMVAAGNSGNGQHWHGNWQDGDGDDWLEFAGSDETMTVGAPLSVSLQWSDWPGSSQNYDLYLLNDSGAIVASSRTVQNGSQPPFESLTYSRSGEYHLKVERVNADGTARFDVFVSGGSADQPRPEYWTAARSTTIPATGPRSTAIGAVDSRDLSLEPFSAQGPTVDGRAKPAFVAPDRVSTSVYSSFAGTSAAAPHAAGAAALLLDGDSTLSPGTIVDRLANGADSLGFRVPNNRVGHGLIDVSRSVHPRAPTETKIRTDPIGADNVTDVEVAVQFPARPVGGDVVVELRDGNGDTVRARAPANTGGRTTVVSVDASALADGEVTARGKIVDDLGRGNLGGFTAWSAAVTKRVRTGVFTVSGLDAPASVGVGEKLAVTATVTNVGDVSDSRVVAFQFQGATVERRTLELASGENTTVNFTRDTGELSPGNYTYAVTTDSSTASGTVEVHSVDVGVPVNLSPSVQTVGIGGIASFDVVTTPTRGLSNYQVTVSVAAPDTANITGVSFGNVSGFTVYNIDNGTVTAAVVGTDVAPTGANRTLLEVAVRGEANGTTDLSLTVESLSDTNNTGYEVGPTPGASVTVSREVVGVAVSGQNATSGTTDADPRHEDVDGDGRFSTSDVQALLDDLVSDRTVVDYPVFFDFNGNGRVDTGDVQALLDDLVSG